MPLAWGGPCLLSCYVAPAYPWGYCWYRDPASVGMHSLQEDTAGAGIHRQCGAPQPVQRAKGGAGNCSRDGDCRQRGDRQLE